MEIAIPSNMNPRSSAAAAYNLVEYALMHPSIFSEGERVELELALEHLKHVADVARIVC
jgi:hypothetical protein